MKLFFVTSTLLCLQFCFLANGNNVSELPSQIIKESKNKHVNVIHSVTRQKRHTLKYGRCKPIKTTLGEGLQILHEIPIRRESFFVRPRATFRKVVLQLRLDNLISRSDPKVYSDSVTFRNSDLKTLNYEPNEWLEVVAEVSKSKRFGPDYWMMRLKIKDWTMENEVSKWTKLYRFGSLVISGEGGCEWSFDCWPDDTVEYYDAQESVDEELDLRDDTWWMSAILAAGLLLAMLLAAMGVYWCTRKDRTETVKDYISKSLSFRKARRQHPTDDIYEELNITSLHRLQHKFADLGVEGFSASPPPLPAFNVPNKPPRMALQKDPVYAKVLPLQQSLDVSDLHEQDWYNSLEQHSTAVGHPKLGQSVSLGGKHGASKLAKPAGTATTGRHSHWEGSQLREDQCKENDYSNCPQKTEKNDIYVEMRNLTKTTPK